jgi:hypothetical protein
MDFSIYRKTWQSVTTGIFECHPQHRIGDEIQLTALYKYFKSKKIQIDYKDCNPYISTLNLFPDNLVRFTQESYFPQINFINLWVWSPFLQHKGFFTETQNLFNHKNDCVFIPCLSPEYNEKRAISNPEEIFQAIKNQYKNSICIVDKEKKHLFKDNNNNVFFSDNIYTTFKIIEKSKIYIGCDTGTSHYAGSINHPNMILIYPDETEVQKRISWQKEIIKYIFDEPEISLFMPSTIPCCNPRNISLLTINNQIDPKFLMQKVLNRIC